MSQDPPKTIKGEIKENIDHVKEKTAREFNDGLTPKNVNAKLSHRHRAIAHLAAIGFSPREIAQQLGVSTSRVSPIFKSESFQKEVAVIQHEFFFKDPQKIFMKILPKAIQRAYEVMMTSKKETTIVDTSFKFMDRALGKPEQRVEHESSGLRQLIDKLDQIDKDQKKKTTIEATSQVIEEADVITEAITDEVEKYVQENYGTAAPQAKVAVGGSPV